MNSAKYSDEIQRGNAVEALACGLRDAGCAFAASYPGFYSHTLGKLLGAEISCVNERIAYAMAWGAAAAGIRSVATFKNVGLNDAADPFLNSQVLGVNAGLVLVVFDDIDGETCQIIQDSRRYQAIQGGFWYEPCSVQDAYETGRMAFHWSEIIDGSVVIRMTNLLSKRHDNYQRFGEVYENLLGIADSSAREFRRRPDEMVVHPLNLKRQSEMREKRNRQINCLAEMLCHSAGAAKGAAADLYFGSALLASRRKRSESINVQTLPIPKPLARSLAEAASVRVHEHGAPVAAEALRAGFSSPPVVAEPVSTNAPNRSYHNRDCFEPLFVQLRAHPERIVSGDLGDFTMDPNRTLDLCLCYGASVAVAAGASQSGERPVFAVTGDGAFLHSGKTALEEACFRALRFRVFVFENGGCRGTGGHPIPARLDCPFPGLVTHHIPWDEVGGEGSLARELRKNPVPAQMELWIIHLPESHGEEESP